ncbi:MAG: hypothetical protein U5N85_22435 [Arcicella sp.]|nr:hypothetical protein [Arcicella sp.]
MRKFTALSPTLFEGKLTRSGGAGCEPDAREGAKIYEFKSWSPNSNDDDVGSLGDDEFITVGGTSAFLKLANNSYSNPTNSYTQFLCYLSNITKMEDLVYIFDKDQLNAKGQTNAVAYIKLRFQELMSKPVEQQQIFDVIWNNTNGLTQDLWKPIDYPSGISKAQAKSIFVNWVSDTNNSIYNFITAR